MLSNTSCDDLQKDVLPDGSRKKEENVSNTGGNVAVTVASVVAAVGLIVAAVVVCLKCRRGHKPIKKHISK